MPYDESVFEFMEMRRESRWEERYPLGRWDGHGVICGNFGKQAGHAVLEQIHTGRRGILQVDRQKRPRPGGGLYRHKL